MTRSRITKKQQEFLSALEKTMGNVSMAAELLTKNGLSVDRTMHYKAMKSNESYRDAYYMTLERNLDIAEGHLLQSIKNGNMKDVQYFLDSKGQDRGYGRKMELRGSATDPVMVATTTPAEIEEARQKLKEHLGKS